MADFSRETAKRGAYAGKNAHMLAEMPGVGGQQQLFDPDPLVWLVEFDAESAGNTP